MSAEPTQLDLDGDEVPLAQLATAAAAIERPPRGPGALCDWCNDPIPHCSADTGRATRTDAETCSRRCRQARHRFGRHAGTATPGEGGPPMRFAYADPPYPGMARLYEDHPDYGGEVDHAELLGRLLADYPDGWALSTSNKTLRQVLALVPDDVDVRIGAWTKPMPPRRAYRARVAWEPVLFCGGRPAIQHDLLDWCHAAPPRAIPGQVIGTKPAKFARWMFRCLGATAGDTLDDLFPGSGAVARAWATFAAGAEPSRSAAAHSDASPRARGDASRVATALRDA